MYSIPFLASTFGVLLLVSTVNASRGSITPGSNDLVSTVKDSKAVRSLGKSCTDDSDCSSFYHICVDRTGFRCASTDTRCICLAQCNGPGDCETGGFCGTINNGTPICFNCGTNLKVTPYKGDRCGTDQPSEPSTTPQNNNPRGTDQPSKTSPPPQYDNPRGTTDCIDAKLLSHLSSSEWVFESHHRASVLCDNYGSCATPGHIVTFNERPMMMRTYCSNFAICVKRVMEVNSPKMRKKVRVNSKTENLLFTPLSARYMSRIEETLLTSLVHMGM